MNRLECARKAARELYRDLPAVFTYHNYRHAMDVMEAALRLADLEGVPAGDREILELAALFHDTGYVAHPAGNESESARIAAATLSEIGYSKDEIQRVDALIAATAIPQRPQGLLQQILCDADLDNLGRDDFKDCLERVWVEMQHRENRPSRKDWLRQLLKLMAGHCYFTLSAQTLRGGGKTANMACLEQMIAQTPEK